jgi:nucleoside-diphosphate-sugar epimerase
MRYLVTGGAGFIGSHTVDELVRHGHQVVVLDDFSAGKEANLAGVAGKIELIRGNISDVGLVQRACRGVDYVLHLAARTSVPGSVENPADTNAVNVGGTLNVLLAARDAKLRRVVYAASCAAYGEGVAVPTSEDAQLSPISPYGVSKLVGELYARAFGRVYGLKNVSLRYFNVFGPRQDATSPYSGVLSRFITALLKGEAPVVFGDGEQTRDFVYVENVVEANLRACEAVGASGQVFNVGSGERFTLNQTLKILEQLSGKPARPRYAPPRAGDIRDSQAEVTRAREFLGYNPRVSFEEGLRRTWEWYRANPMN